MKKYFSLISILLVSFPMYAQYQARASMGIDFVSTPSLTDYINIYIQPATQLGSFNSAVVFSGELGYNVESTFQIGIELAYSLNSYTSSLLNGQYDLSYGIIMPSLNAYYLISGEGYNFKFGGGGGVRLVSADESLPGLGAAINYSSTGVGFILRVEGNTLLGGNFYASIGGDLRYDINGKPSNGDNFLGGRSDISTNFNSFSAGIKLGISYLF